MKVCLLAMLAREESNITENPSKQEENDTINVTATISKNVYPIKPTSLCVSNTISRSGIFYPASESFLSLAEDRRIYAVGYYPRGASVFSPYLPSLRRIFHWSEGLLLKSIVDVAVAMVSSLAFGLIFLGRIPE